MSQEARAKKSKIIYIILIILFAAIFIGCAIYLITYLLDSMRQSSQYGDLSSIVASIRAEVNANPDKNTLPTGPRPTEGGENADTSYILPEYLPAYQQNNDLVGWITIPGTRVDYPVCQTTREKDYYLYRDFEGNDSQSGCIYVREACNVFTPSDNVVIYGHRMNSGAMFADLLNFRQKDFFLEHQTFTFDTIYERHTYQIIAVFITSANYGQGYPYHQFNEAANQAEFDDFIKNIQELSLYDTGHTAEYGDMLITLSTCTRRWETPANGRFVVVAKRIS